MRRSVLAAAVSAVLVSASWVATAGSANALPPVQPFSTLAPGFTQELYATGLPPYFGIGFASNGDVFVSEGTMQRIDSHSTITVNGSTIHPTSMVSEPVNLGFGLANTASGALYANAEGVLQLDPATGQPIGSTFGQGAGFLGIVPDPQTGNLVYQDDNNGISYTSPNGASTGTFAAVGADGIAFDPTGNYLFVATFGGIDVVNRAGNVVQFINLSSGPDGMAFHAGSPGFLVSNNNDGTITRYDFPNNDYTQPPTQSVFASGGSRGDLTAVGPDGCLYASQNHTQFADGTMTTSGSIVRICGGFVGVGCSTTITGTHSGFTVAPGTTTCVTGGKISGGISVAKGGSLVLTKSTVSGSISATGPAMFTACGSKTGGITVNGASGPVLIGDPANDCAANTINGSLTVANTAGGLTVVGNTITGSWTFSNNASPVTVSGNHH